MFTKKIRVYNNPANPNYVYTQKKKLGFTKIANLTMVT